MPKKKKKKKKKILPKIENCARPFFYPALCNAEINAKLRTNRLGAQKPFFVLKLLLTVGIMAKSGVHCKETLKLNEEHFRDIYF